MTTVIPIEGRIAANLKGRRETLGLSLGQLAGRSGVSKAMIAKIESGASSPTASLLGRLCAGLGVTLSTLMNSVESAELTLFRAGSQPTWHDSDTGLLRTLVASASPTSPTEIARLQLPPGTTVAYDVIPRTPVRQHIYLLAGVLCFTIGGETTVLRPGDCLFATIDRPTRFEVPGPDAAEYLVIQEPA